MSNHMSPSSSEVSHAYSTLCEEGGECKGNILHPSRARSTVKGAKSRDRKGAVLPPAPLRSRLYIRCASRVISTPAEPLERQHERDQSPTGEQRHLGPL